MEQLDARIPLLHTERKLIVESLYDLAFRDGAWQGRRAGIEAVQAHIRSVAAETPTCAPLLLAIADSFDLNREGEYADPTKIIREKLSAKARARNGLL
jgi:hypothetical protein